MMKNLPPRVQQSFDAKLLSIGDNWISQEDLDEIQKINKFYRFGFTQFPGATIRLAMRIVKSLPAQGGETFRFRRYDRLPYL